MFSISVSFPGATPRPVEAVGRSVVITLSDNKIPGPRITRNDTERRSECVFHFCVLPVGVSWYGCPPIGASLRELGQGTLEQLLVRW